MDPSTIAEALYTVSQDDQEESVKIDKSPLLSPEEQSQENTEPVLLSHTITPKYYSVMDDEGPDEVSVQPPFLPSRLDPEGGSTCEAPAIDPSVNLRPCDTTEANANPECLDWHHGERQLMTSYSPPHEDMESAITNFGEVVRRKSSGGTQCTGQELKLMDEKVIQDCEETADKSNDEKPEDQTLELKSLGDMDLLEETGVTHSCQKLEERNLASQDLNYVSDNSEEEGIESKLMDVRSLDCEFTAYDWVKRTSVEDVEEAVVLEHRKLDDQEEVAETIKDSKIATEILQGEDLLQRLQLVQQRQDLAETFQETQKLDESLLWTENLAKEDPDINQEIQKQEQTEHESEEETSVLTVTEHFEHCSIHKTDVVSCNEESDLRNNVNLTETSAGEDVCKHLEQDMPGSESTAEQIVGIDLLTKDWGLEDECSKTEGAFKEEQTCTEENNDSEEDNEDVKENTCLPLLSPERIDIKGSDIENTDTWMNEDRIPIPLCHRLSAAETYMEKQFQEASQIKRDLQRADGVFDLSDDPDILEIPFKTSISLESLPSQDDLVQRGNWHFSEQKMQKEISQEMQRELVLVNLGKIPGGYSKGESRQMRDTKLLFEAFQQDKTEGPTRIRKPQTSLLKSQVYPSVLERTRSLEMFSHKMSPMLRTHSFRIMSSSEKEKHPEMFRSQSPSLRDKARLSPYPKHEKPPRKHKSMDSINVTSSTTSRDRVKNSKEEPLREGSPLLKENPFFKLRPALSLQPEVEKDIREAKKREEELRKQRSSLYGETKLVNKEEGKSAQLKADAKQKTTGKLERVWPPPSKKDSTKAEQQETRVQRVPGHRAALWQRWESGLINGQTTSSNNNRDNSS